MLLNYLRIGFRNLIKHKIYSVVNVAGLTLAFLAAIFISAYVFDELSFDSVHPKHDRVFRIGTGYANKEGTRMTYLAPGDWGTSLKNEIPSVESVLRFKSASFPTGILTKEGKRILTDDIRWVESTLPEVLLLPLVDSNMNVFSSANAMVISQSAAKALFGDEEPIGQIVTINDKEVTNAEDVEMMITGVYHDYPLNSTFRASYLLNIESLRRFQSKGTDLLDSDFLSVYVVLKESSDVASVESFLKAKCAVINRADEVFHSTGTEMFPIIRNIKALHFDEDVTWDFRGTFGSKKYLAIFGGIGVLLLLLSCINYANLALARASLRAKEVYVKKTFGSSKLRLVTQFLIESAVVSITSLTIAFVFSIILLSIVDDIFGKTYLINNLFRPEVVAVLLGAACVVSFVAGIYPALMLTGQSPSNLLNENLNFARSNSIIRRSLVVFQIVTAFTLSISALTVMKQMNLIYDSKLNERGDQIMAIRWSEDLPVSKYEVLKNELLRTKSASFITIGNHLPRLDHFGSLRKSYRANASAESFEVDQLSVDMDFAKTFGLEVRYGRDFDASIPSDSNTFLVNETAAKAFGIIPDQAPGHVLENIDTQIFGRIVGVVKDFPYKSAKHAIGPLIIYPRPQSRGSIIFVRLDQGQIEEQRAGIERAWQTIIPESGIESWFVSDVFDRLYKTELTLLRLIQNFAMLIAGISLLGLFALTTLSVESRKKEIGIRKVLGAPIAGIYWLFTWDFVKIFVISAVIAIPIAYFALNNWLEGFSYRVAIGLEVFTVGIVSFFAIMIITISVEVIKAALANPTKTLRNQ